MRRLNILREWREWAPALLVAVVLAALAVMFVVSARPIRESDCIRGAHPAVVLEACRNVQK